MQNSPHKKYPRIDERAVEEVRARADILEVVGERVALKKSGRDHKGLCPFHAERTPSFYVSPLKGIFKCFGCGAGGDVFEFMARYESIDFPEAVLELGRRYGVDIQVSSAQVGTIQGGTVALHSLLEVCEAAADFYERMLWGDQGKSALDYLVNSRGLDGETIRRFRLGYALPEWQALGDYLAQDKGFAFELVAKAGLAVPRSSGRGYYDRFRGRVMIPIQDGRGRVIAFGGRSLDGSEPKYLNSPETELFVKGKTLYALDKAKEAIAREDRVIVVEGYFDTIALHCVGICNAVAVLGTALSPEQLQQLLRFTASRRVVLAFDGDAAGIKAAERATEELASLRQKAGVLLAVLQMNGAKDADEFLKSRGADEYRALVAEASDWFTWRSGRLLARCDLAKPLDLEEALGGLTRLLTLPMSLAVREGHIREMANRLARGGAGLAVKLEDTLHTRMVSGGAPKPRPPGTSAPRMSPACRAEVQILSIYLHRAEMRESIHQAAEQFAPLFTEPVHARLWGVLEKSRYKSAEAIFRLREALVEDTEGTARLEALLWLTEWEQHTLDRPAEMVKAALASLLVGRYEAELGKVGALSDEAEARGDWEESLRLMALYQEQATRIRELHTLLAFKPSP